MQYGITPTLIANQKCFIHWKPTRKCFINGWVGKCQAGKTVKRFNALMRCYFFGKQHLFNSSLGGFDAEQQGFNFERKFLFHVLIIYGYLNHFMFSEKQMYSLF